MIETDVAMGLKKTHQWITQLLQHKIDEYGLTFGLLSLAIRIHKNPDASQKELAKQMRFTEGAMSVAVKRLINLNMIEQIPLKSDMRYNRLITTDFGESVIDNYREYVFKKYQDIFEGFNEKELKELDNALSKINKNLEEMNYKSDLKEMTE